MSSRRETILIIDDTEANIEILHGLLSEEYDIMVALNGAYGLSLAEEQQPDIILLDIVMPDIDGYEICRSLKSSDRTESIPVIFITAEADEASIEKAYDAGGMDYIAKPIKPKELFARVRAQLKISMLIQRLEQSKNELTFLAATDYLTKLYNRRYFTEKAQALISHATQGDEISLCVIDIDNFKRVNDTYGHSVGDQVIKHLADTLRALKSEGDIAARYGGEEFALLMPDTDFDTAYARAEKIRKYIMDASLYIDGEHEIAYAISIGLSRVDFEEKHPVSSAFLKADNALYRAKKSGKNLVCTEV